MRILIFGTGKYYNMFKKWIPSENIIGLLDNNVDKQGTIVDGHRVFSPIEGVKQPYDYIYILSTYDSEMRGQLHHLGVPSSKIRNQFELAQDGLVRAAEVIKYSVADPNEKIRIAMLSFDLQLNGGSAALVNAATVLKEVYSVTVISQEDGEFRSVLTSEGIDVWIDGGLLASTMAELKWVNEFTLLFCNTINFYHFLAVRNTKIPVVWWLHDAPVFYEGISTSVISCMNMDNLFIYSVGDIPRKAFQRYCPSAYIKSLLYGIDDLREKQNIYSKSDEINFGVVGIVQKWKGQDVFVEAVKMIPTALRKRAIFWIVGNNSSLFAHTISEEIKEYPEIRMTGELSRSEMKEVYNRVDVLICPSRDDSMPIVATEAMMMGKPCIVSDAAGTAKYISNENNGMVFHSEDPTDLADKMMVFLRERNLISKMGNEARKIYENHFSMKIFRRNILNIFESVLQEEC